MSTQPHHRVPNQPVDTVTAQSAESADGSSVDLAVGELISRDRGQATTEYALVLLAAALVAVLVIGWATAGGGAAAIGKLFDTVIDAVIGKV